MTSPVQTNQKNKQPNPYVLAGRQLRPGIKLSDTSRFNDSVWRLEPAQLQYHDKALSLNFKAFPPRMRQPAKMLAYALLAQAEPDETHSSINGVRKRIGELRRFCAWLHAHGYSLQEVQPEQLLAYQTHLREVLATAGARQTALSVVRMLWTYRDHLGAWGLDADPRDIADYGLSIPRTDRGENRTDRIPEQVLSPLMRWALRFIDDFSNDILAAIERRSSLLSDPPTSLPPDAARSQIVTFLRTYEVAGKPLPGFRGQPNMVRIARMAGVPRRAGEAARALMDETAAVVGVDDASYLDVPICGRLADRRWTEGIGTTDSHEMAVSRLARMLQAACYITIAYLSGMRDSEIKHLQRGCATVVRDENGVPYRWLVRSLAFKGENNPMGVEATWVIGEPASRAISVLESLIAPDNPWMFAPIPLGPGTGPAKRSTTKAMIGTATINSLNEFVTWVNTYCNTRAIDDRIPDVDGKSWHLTTAQFRRTLAWFIARRPGGAIAGAIAYRHHSIRMFEGYAGTSASGFRAEVEAEQALARGEQLLDMIERHHHSIATGPAAQELERRLDELAYAADNFEGTVVTDGHRLRRLMATADPQVFPSQYVTCVYNPDKALCHRETNYVSPQPSTAHCHPMSCHNVALTDSNRNQWNDEIAEISEALRRRPTLPPVLAHRLKQREHEISELLADVRKKPIA